MKKLLIIFGTLFMLSCGWDPNGNGLPNGWAEMPIERIKSYFSCEGRNSFTYISDSSTAMVFETNYCVCQYSPYYSEKHSICSKCANSEYINCSLDMWTEDRNGLYTHFDLGSNRITLYICYKYTIRIVIPSEPYYETIEAFGSFQKEFENNLSKDKGMGYPKNPNEFLEYLTDTIDLSHNNKIMGQLVAGKGLVWFTDNNGVIWNLAE